MKEKLLNQFSTLRKEEEIVVEVIETEKGIKVNIKGQTMDVIINGEEFYSKYDKEEYKYIPSHLRGFVEKYLPSYGYIEKENGYVEIKDLCIEGIDYLVKIPTNKSKKKSVEFVSYLNDYKLIEEDLEIKIPDAKEKYDELLKDINEYGYNLTLSHGGNENYNWYSLQVPIKLFDEENILKCLTLWKKYDKELDDLIQ